MTSGKGMIHKVYRISLTSEECYLIEYVIGKVWEWSVNDNRLDHGLAKLQLFKENKENEKLLDLFTKFRRQRMRR